MVIILFFDKLNIIDFNENLSLKVTNYNFNIINLLYPYKITPIDQISIATVTLFFAFVNSSGAI